MLGGTLLLPPADPPSIRLLLECLAAGCYSHLSATQHPEARSSPDTKSRATMLRTALALAACLVCAHAASSAAPAPAPGPPQIAGLSSVDTVGACGAPEAQGRGLAGC